MSVRPLVAITSAVGLCGIALGASPALAQGGSWPNVTVMRAVHQDVSQPLRDIKITPRAPTGEKRAKRIRPIPLPRDDASAPAARDGAVQLQAGPMVKTNDDLNFAGVGNDDYSLSPNYAPPDTAGAVGKDQYVHWVNTEFAVFNKANGNLLLGPLDGNALWSGFGGGCETNNDGDVIVQYDKMADRWVLSQFSVSSLPYLECVAVSKTSDATGAYYRYAFDYGNTDFVDYPKMGVWPDGYYVTYNVFTLGRFFGGAKVCALDRAKMLRGRAATQQCVQLSSDFGGLLPADLDGDTLPPNGSPNYLFSLGTTRSLQLWRFKVDWANPANSVFSGPDTLSVPRYAPACGGGACIPQSGVKQKLDSLADRLMYRAAYRKIGRQESVVLNHSVDADGRTGVRWYEIRKPGGSPQLFQSGTYAPGDLSRWMGSIGMDKRGNIAVGYSSSSSAAFPSIAYTGRNPSDPLGQLQSEKLIRAGAGSQNGGLSRWGDYSTLSIDPENDCTFWFSSEYLKANGSFNWSTRIGSFKFKGC